MAKEIIGQYENAFNSTKIGNDLNTKLSVITEKMENLRKAEKAERIAKVSEVMENVKIGKISKYKENEFIGKVVSEVMAKYEDLNNKLIAEKVSVKSEIANAYKSYTQKIKSNDAWNNLVCRKATPKLLKSMLNRNGATERQMELDLHGCLTESGKQNRFCFPIESMEVLGWINRIGSGNIGDAKVCRLTDEGKRQLDYYEKYGMFDCSKIA